MIYNEGNDVPLPNLDLLTLLFGAYRTSIVSDQDGVSSPRQGKN
jgi:hypothetical protein